MVDQGDLAIGFEWSELEFPLQGPDLFDLDAGSVRFNGVKIRVVAVLHFPACRTLATALAGLAEKGSSQGQRRQAFADAVRSGEQVGMGQMPRFERPRQDFFLPVMTKNMFEAHGCGIFYLAMDRRCRADGSESVCGTSGLCRYANKDLKYLKTYIIGRACW